MQVRDGSSALAQQRAMSAAYHLQCNVLQAYGHKTERKLKKLMAEAMLENAMLR